MSDMPIARVTHRRFPLEPYPPTSPRQCLREAHFGGVPDEIQKLFFVLRSYYENSYTGQRPARLVDYMNQYQDVNEVDTAIIEEYTILSEYIASQRQFTSRPTVFDRHLEETMYGIQELEKWLSLIHFAHNRYCTRVVQLALDQAGPLGLIQGPLQSVEMINLPVFTSSSRTPSLHDCIHFDEPRWVSELKHHAVQIDYQICCLSGTFEDHEWVDQWRNISRTLKMAHTCVLSGLLEYEKALGKHCISESVIQQFPNSVPVTYRRMHRSGSDIHVEFQPEGRYYTFYWWVDRSRSSSCYSFSPETEYS